MAYFTKSPNTKVFNIRGTHSATIREKDTLVTVSGAQVVIPAGRGLCFPISNPFVGFVKINELRFEPVFPPPDPDPDPEPIPNPDPTEGLYQFHGDPDPRAVSMSSGGGTADVLPLIEQSMEITREWQLFIRAINPNMTPNHVSGLLGYQKAFTNNQGFGNPSSPRANYIVNSDLSSPLPKFPKVFTCGLNCHEGVETYSVVQAIKNTVSLLLHPLREKTFAGFRQSFVSMFTQNNTLVVHTLNGNIPPPDVAVVNPATRLHLFFHATIVRIRNNREARYPFPNGAPAWGYLGNYVFMPLVSRFPVQVPLSMAHKVTSYVLPYTER